MIKYIGDIVLQIRTIQRKDYSMYIYLFCFVKKKKNLSQIKFQPEQMYQDYIKGFLMTGFKD